MAMWYKQRPFPFLYDTQNTWSEPPSLPQLHIVIFRTHIIKIWIFTSSRSSRLQTRIFLATSEVFSSELRLALESIMSNQWNARALQLWSPTTRLLIFIILRLRRLAYNHKCIRFKDDFFHRQHQILLVAIHTFFNDCQTVPPDNQLV